MLQRIHQMHGDGCFIACVAILLGISYEDSFRRLFPNKIMRTDSYWESNIALTVEQSLDMLPHIGIQLQKTNLRNVKLLKGRTSFIILRWKNEPNLSHGLIFDGSSGKFLDPVFYPPLNHSTYNRNLENIYYVKRISHKFSISSINANRLQNCSRLSNTRSLSGSQAFDGSITD